MQGILVRALNRLKLRFAKIQYHIDFPRKIKITAEAEELLTEIKEFAQNTAADDHSVRL